MATTSIWSVKGWLGKLVIYIENRDKTQNPDVFEVNMDNKQMQSLADVIRYAVNTEKTTAMNNEKKEVLQNYVTGVNCSSLTARNEMMAVKKRFGKSDGVVAYHGYQSFAPGEADPATAHTIGVKLAEELWGEKYQVLVATHLDKENHLHNHFVVNSVSFLDGIRYHRTEKDYYNMRRESDRLCKEYGLSTIEDAIKVKGKHYGEWRAEQEGRPTWRGLIKADVDAVIKKSMTDKQFFYYLRQMGYDIKFGKDITVRPPGKERGLKLARNFGSDYTETAIRRRILQQCTMSTLRRPENQQKRITVCQKVTRNPNKVGGLHGLYLHYCYRLHIFKQQPMSEAQLHFLLREDLIKLNSISKEARLLCTHNIETTEQLFSYKSKLTEEIKSLVEERKTLRYQLKGLIDEEKTEVGGKIAEISNQLRQLRKEIDLCDNIMTRSVEMKSKLQTVETQAKEVQNDKRRRCIRTSR